MKTLVYIDGADGEIKKSSLEALAYATAIHSDTITAIAAGSYSEATLTALGQYGATAVLHVSAEATTALQLGATIAKAAAESGAELVIVPRSTLTDAAVSRAAAQLGAAIVTNVISVADTSVGFVVRRPVFTGKAFETVNITAAKKIITLAKNVVTPTQGTGTATITKMDTPWGAALNNVVVTKKEKATGVLSLTEADIVVSGGRGLKGPEHWGIITDLAAALGAATGCSKPVSDLDWRPHHEHVGQTGVKVSPNIYIAVGISGAIQHLAGVNSSRCIVVINKDPEAPFFKAADYGIVGDAFEVLPKLIAALK
jgi:electron transfer flavoprotein alpha subunit